MEGYYSSDDDVAWGPYTLSEVKRDIREALPPKINRRHTYSAPLDKKIRNMKSYKTEKENNKCENEDIAEISQRMSSKLNISGTSSSEYFTPNETFKSGVTSVNEFLDKMKKAIEEPMNNRADEIISSNEDACVIETEAELEDKVTAHLQHNFRKQKRENHSMLDFLKLANFGGTSMLGNIEPTLVENTIVISSDEEEEIDTKIVKEENLTHSYLFENSCYDTSSEVEMIEMNETSDADVSANVTNLENSMLCSFSGINTENNNKCEIFSTNEDVVPNSTVERVETETQSCEADNSALTRDSLECSSSHNGCKETTEVYEKYRSRFSDSYLPKFTDKMSNSLLVKNEAKEDDEIAFSSLESVSNEKPDIENIIKRLSNDLQLEDEATDSFSTNSNDHSDTSYFGELKNVKCEPETCTDSYFTSSTSQDSSHVFNDTLEEMDMVLKYGIDYKMPGDIQSSSAQKDQSLHYANSEECEKVVISDALISPKSASDAINHETRIPKFKGNHLKIQTEGSLRSLKQHSQEAHAKINFKVPSTPSRLKITPIKSPSSQSKKFRDIVSPVGIYIKHSPATFIKRTVVAKDVTNRPAKIPTGKILRNIENTVLPEVVYKPARNNVVFREKAVVLPKSIKKLICEPGITKHEARITGKVSDTSIGTKLEVFEQELTCALIDENTLDMTGDTSFLSKKQGFNK